jgi:5-methylcytosine-specific restriction protein A
MMPRKRRPSRELWNQIRQQVWERDDGRCQGPYCRNAPPLPLSEVHIDHKVPISANGSNALSNLRTLCRRCHVLRSGRAHAGMIASALRDGIIPPDWRSLIWDDDDLTEERNTP